MAAVQLITFVEREFEIAIDDEDLKLENFDSIVAIESLVGAALEKRLLQRKAESA
jgi:acyl carrier protein